MKAMTRRMRRRTAAVVLVGFAVLGCGPDDDTGAPDPSGDDPVAGDEQPAPDADDQPGDATDGGDEPPDEDTDDPAGDTADDGDADDSDADDGTDDPEPIADGGDTDPDEAQGTSPGTGEDGNPRPQAVTDVRVASHDRFDRVVFELESDGGTPGWFVGYDEPTAQGSGEPVEVDGGASLSVLISPVTLPPDLPSNVRTWDDGPIEGPAGGLVRQVVDGSVYEGYHQFFVGVDEQRPFAVERLDDPPRVVIDIFRSER